ncbi:sensor domain-containing diguanylate cyclase [Bacillus infantis]|uniref:sensor domain-containing diguanylate cyclase n=1 Tax=Bacillus infantis TaxID=324767 RepID=UPI00209D6AEE|nr:sensor domain-containing diguanylate cyclase [Bacillus infantis]MCP1157103.1 sensor domain-containing diguanylate cyclase [Bacillus infantis]
MMNIQFAQGFGLGALTVVLIVIYVFRRWKKKETDSFKNHESYMHVIENTKDFLYYCQVYPELQFKYLGPSAECFFGEGSNADAYSDAGVAFRDIHPEDMDILQKKVHGQVDFNQAIVQRWKDKDGNYRWFEEYATPIYENGVLVALQGVVRNIDERKKLEETLTYRIAHDALTDIYNREFFEQMMEKYNEREDIAAAIILCDLDGLKCLNDNHGHKTGDFLIKETAHLLERFFTEDAYVSRIGGDEFAVILLKKEKEQVELLAEKLAEEISRYNESSQEVKINLSIGFAFSENSRGVMERLFVEADNHMYQHKRTKKGA